MMVQYIVIIFFDFTLNLNGLHILKALTLNIQTSGEFTNMLEGSHSIALIYKIYYKYMKINLNVHALVKSPKDKTLLIQSSISNAHVRLPKPILQKYINQPVTWLFDNESYQSKIQNDIVDLDYIQQYLDGIVKISFDDLRINTPSRHSLDNRSTASIASVTRKDKNLVDSLEPKVKLQGIKTS